MGDARLRWVVGIGVCTWGVLLALFCTLLTASAVSAAGTLGGAGSIIYVKADATGAKSGASWTDAFATLQPALDVASPGSEIWVATGTYMPTRPTSPGNPRSATFRLVDGVALYGGFAGTETRRDRRDWDRHPTVLSGDLGIAGDITDNAYHVVTSVGADADAVLDGFTITAANADAYDAPDDRGGAFLDVKGSPTLLHCTFRTNAAIWGAALFSEGGSPQVTACAFLDNAAFGGGGAYFLGGGPWFDRCTFQGNSAFRGGGISNLNAAITLTHCMVQGNEAGDGGGGIYTQDGSVQMVDCVIRGNSAGVGGGLGSFGGIVMLTNCTLEHNRAELVDGGAMDDLTSQIDLRNCVVWDNGPNPLTSAASRVTLSYSLVQGGCPIGSMCDHILLSDPLFVSAPATTPAEQHDLRLRAASPAIDAGYDPYLALPSRALGGAATLADAGRDCAGSPRIVGAHVDMGAYESGPDLAISQIVVPSATYRPGDAIAFGLRFANTGLYTATAVLITDIVPAELTALAVQTSVAGIVPIGDVAYTWRLPDLGPGMGGVITLSGVLDPLLPGGYSMVNGAAIACGIVEASLANNVSEVTVTVDAAPATPTPTPANEFYVHGKVIAFESGQTLAGATVRLYRSTEQGWLLIRSGVTDSSGLFGFAVSPIAANYRLSEANPTDYSSTGASYPPELHCDAVDADTIDFWMPQGNIAGPFIFEDGPLPAATPQPTETATAMATQTSAATPTASVSPTPTVTPTRLPTTMPPTPTATSTSAPHHWGISLPLVLVRH